MTAILAWRSPKNTRDAVYVVADSRVSQGRSVLLDVAAKILPLRVAATCGNPQKPDEVLRYYSHTIGYAFAGSSLIGLNTYGHLATRLGSLIGLNDTAIPPLRDCAQLGAELLVNQCRDWEERREERHDCRALVFGYCSVEGKAQVFLLEPNGFGEVSFEDPRWFGYIGQAHEEIATRVAEVRSTLEEGDPRWWWAPKKVLEEFIDNEQFPGIGGPVTMAIGSADGIDLFSESTLAPPETPRVLAASYFGDGNRVGPCFAGPGAILRESW